MQPSRAEITYFTHQMNQLPTPTMQRVPHRIASVHLYINSGDFATSASCYLLFTDGRPTSDVIKFRPALTPPTAAGGSVSERARLKPSINRAHGVGWGGGWEMKRIG